jgi:alpha-L-arabinofuranosidase
MIFPTLFACVLVTLGAAAAARELHVAFTGSDSNDGSPARPFRTVQHAATQASSGDSITVHAGTYRERVHPPTGGVTFQAMAGDTVILSGSEPVSGWSHVANDTWRHTLPSFATFGNFNPYMDTIFGDWFDGQGLTHHTGAVYFGAQWLDEAPSLPAVLSPLAPGAAPRWFATVDGDAGQYLMNILWLAPRGGLPVSAGAPSWRYGSKPYNSSAGPCSAFILPGNVLRFDAVDFGSGAVALDFAAAAAAGGGGVVQVFAGDRWGTLLGSAPVPSTGGWEAWRNFSVPLAPTSGVLNVTLVFLPPGYLEGNTTIYAQVPPGVDPNAASEIHVRQTVFYPSGPFVDNITVRGFTLERAATQWAPPSSEQVGIIGTHWSKGWLIEDNEVRYSRCSCVALGKYGDGFDNTNDEGQADPYTACVYRALANGWHKDRVGSHTVRNNVRLPRLRQFLPPPPPLARPFPFEPPPLQHPLPSTFTTAARPA